MQTSLAKKLFAAGMALSTAAMALAPFAAHAAAHAVGTNVKTSDGTVWMIMPDGTRRAYTSAGAFLSYGFNSFATLVDANSDDAALPQGAFIPPQDGTIFCATATKASDVKGECSLITGGMKAAFTSESNFTGRGFSFSNAQYGDSSFLTKTTNIDNTTDANRPGVLVNDNGTVKLVGNNGVLGIPDLATFNSWGYSWAKVVPANAADKALPQTGVMAARQAGQLSPTALTGGNTGGNNPPPVVSGNVSASLAYDTPAAQTVAVHTSYKSVVTLAKFSFSGTGTVTQMQVKRIGVSADSALSNVYLFNGDTRLTDAASVGGSSLITFNNPSGLFTVNGSMTISVVAEIAANTSSGVTIGAQLTSYTVANGSPASVSISGNLYTVSSTTDLAYATFGTVTPTGGAYDAAPDTEVFRSNVSINTRDMTMSRFILRNIGSVQQADLNNFRLRIDGTQIAQTQSMDANGYVTFSFSPVTLKAGTRVFSVLADIISGSSRNFQFQVRNVADVNFTDTQYGVTVAASNTFPVGSASSNSVNQGTMTMVKATNSPSGNITDGASDVVLAKYTVTAYGEAQKIETITFGATSSNASVGSLRNGRVLINGVQYGSTATLAKTTNSAYTTGGTSYTLNYTVTPGTPVTMEIHADMYDNDGTNSLVNTNTVTAVLMAGSSNVQKMVSLGYISVPSAYVLGNSLTDVTGSATVSKNTTYASQTTPLPQTAYKIASFNLVGSTSEDINVSSIDIAIGASSTLSSLNNVKVLVNGNMFGTIKSTVTMPGSSSTSTTDANPAATSTFSGNYTLPQNTTVSVEVFGDIPTPSVGYGSDHFTTRIAVNGTTANSSASVTTAAAGQQISVGNASLTVAQDSSTPAAALVAGSQTKTVAAYKFTTSNDQYTISDLTLSVPTSTTISRLSLWDGSTQLGQSSPVVSSGSSTFSSLNWQIPANSTKILTVQAQFGTVGYGAGTSGEQVQVTLHSYKNAPSSTGTYTTTTDGSTAGKVMYVFKAIPTITNVSLPTGVLTPGGTNTLSKFSISSGGTGTIGWTHLVFNYSTSSGVSNLTNVALWDADANTQITASSAVNFATKQIVFDTSAEQQITGAKNYALKATVTGGSTSGDYVSTSIANPNTTFSQPATAASATSSGVSVSFAWSDVSALNHSLTTSDWNNDFLVKNLPTDSQSIVK